MDRIQQNTLDRMDRVENGLRGEMNRGFALLTDELQKQRAEHARDMRWVMGFLLTNTAAILGLFARLMFS